MCVIQGPFCLVLLLSMEGFSRVLTVYLGFVCYIIFI